MLALVALSSRAETGKFNVNADLGLTAPLTGNYGTGVGQTYFAQALGPMLSVGVDYQLLKPLAIEAMVDVGLQFIPSWLSARAREKLPPTVFTLGLGIGPRLRLFDSGKGNLWASAHAGVRTLEGAQFSGDVGVGYQFALTRALALGPYGKGIFVAPGSASKRGATILVALGVSGSFDLVPFPAPVPPPVDDDGDGITNDVEIEQFHTDPSKADTDGDGLIDRIEVTGHTDPLRSDTDNDGISDGEEDKNHNGVLDEGESDPRAAPPPVVVAPVEPPKPPPPPPDTDGDGLPDPTDNCPKVAGPADNQGCPKEQKQLVVITKEKIEILEKVYFNTRDASVLPKSFGLLDQVASILLSHPEIKRVSIEGHTDNVGDPSKNQALSQKRAEAVFKYLTITAKVEPGRLEPLGYGQSRPAASNDTPEGREKNRRVEFKIVGD